MAKKKKTECNTEKAKTSRKDALERLRCDIQAIKDSDEALCIDEQGDLEMELLEITKNLKKRINNEIAYSKAG